MKEDIQKRLELAEKYKLEAINKIVSHRDGYIEGYKTAKKENNKQIKDLYNAINSQHKEATIVKLGRKEYRTEKILKLEAQLEILNKLVR